MVEISKRTVTTVGTRGGIVKTVVYDLFDKNEHIGIIGSNPSVAEITKRTYARMMRFSNSQTDKKQVFITARTTAEETYAKA